MHKYILVKSFECPRGNDKILIDKLKQAEGYRPAIIVVTSEL